MNTDHVELSRLLQLLQAGGWVIAAGIQVKDRKRPANIRGVGLQDEQLRFQVESQAEVLLEVKMIAAISFMPDAEQITAIEIFDLVKVRELRSRRDGGGYHEVERPRLLLRVENMKLLEELRREREQQEKSKKEQEKQEQTRLRLERERADLIARQTAAHAEKEARIKAFFERQLESLRGATLTELTLDNDGKRLNLVFSNGRKLKISAYGWDWEESWLKMSGVEEQIFDLCSGTVVE